MKLRLCALAEEVQDLRRQVVILQTQVVQLSGVPLPVRQSAAPPRAETKPVAQASVPEIQRVSTAGLLSNLAALSFVLVVALLLRMLADHEIVGRRVGTGLGLAYAALLMTYGFYHHSSARRPFPIYALSGVLLLFTIVYEAHMRFGVLTAPAAYALLAAGILSMAGLAWRFDLVLPLYVGTLGGQVTGMALGFPNLGFLPLCLFMLLANLIVFAATRNHLARPLFWLSLGLTMAFWGLWALKIRTAFGRGEVFSENLAPAWLLPLLGVYVAMYIAMVLWCVSKRDWEYLLLDGALPILNVVFAYSVACSVAEATGAGQPLIALVASLLAVGLVVLAVAVALSKGRERKPTTTFTVAAVILLAAALPDVFASDTPVLLLWSAVALAIAALSFVRENRLARATAYLFQVFVCGYAAWNGVFAGDADGAIGAAVLALVLMGLCLAQYAWCRHHAACADGTFFRCVAVLLLFSTATYGFFIARLVLAGLTTGAGFEAAQSIVINVGALLLLVLGLSRRNGQVLAAGFLAIVLGGLKVFGFDLTHLRDLPLILSLAVFGITAAGASLTWGKWVRCAASEHRATQ